MDEKGAAVALITLFAFRPTTRASKNKATWACFGDRTAAVELAVRTMLSAGTPPAPTTILCYLDNQERPDHQTDACDSHVSELSAELRWSTAGPLRIRPFLASYCFPGGFVGATSIQDSWRMGVSGAMLPFTNVVRSPDFEPW